MNSLVIRNIALLIIFCLLWVVFHGIYKNHNQYSKAQKAQTYREQRTEPHQSIRQLPTAPPVSSIASSDSDQRNLTAEEVNQIAITGRLPKWVKNADSKRLSVDEVEEIVTTGQLPSSRR